METPLQAKILCTPRGLDWSCNCAEYQISACAYTNMNSLHLYLNSTHEQTHQPVFRDMRTNKQTDRCGHILLICRLTLPGYICSLGFVHIFISRSDYLLDAGSISPFFKKKKSHSCIYGSVINLADRCLLRRYKQPNNRVCLGCDDSRCAVQKKTQQVFTKNESEWNQQFTALYSAAAEDRQRREIVLFLSCFVSAAQLTPVEKVPPGLTLPSWCHASASPFSPG